MKKKAPVSIIVCAIVILVASFMPWGSFQVARPPLNNDFFSGSSPYGGTQMTFTITAWNGNITFAGITIPNWLTV